MKGKGDININQLSIKHILKHDQIKSSVYLYLEKPIGKDTH